MDNVQIISIAGWVLAVISFLVALVALRRVAAIKEDLKENYWTKEVVGKTINAKTGKDQKQAEKIQEKVLNGEVEEISCSDVKEFSKFISENVDNDPLPCSNPMTRQLGVSYVDGGQKYYISLSLTAFKDGQDDLPIKFEGNMEASEFLQSLIDHYKKDKK